MPKIPNKDWKINEEHHKEYINYLGNLTLLGQEYNRKIQNFSFIKKKETYSCSKIQITRDLLDYDYWNHETIINRQATLCAKALEIWAI